METCTSEFKRLADHVGGIRCDGNAFLTVRNPFSLDNWTMPVIELLLIVGAVACLVHAIRWKRRTGDSSNVVVWFAGVFCLLLIEPIAYFPQWFGLEDALGLTFVHNQFTIQFLYDRLPLYIIAMYPVYTYIAYVLVQRTGIFHRYHPIVGATCVTFAFHCLYEVIDTVGVQLQWWVWNENLSTSVPSLGAVPLINIQAFSLGIPFGIALVTMLVSRQRDVGAWRVVRNIVLVCVFVWPILFLSSAPATIIDLAGTTTETARLWATWGLIIVVAAVSIWAFVGDYRHRRTETDLVPAGVDRDRFALITVAIYLTAAVVFWIYALPDYLDAVDGITPSGAPIGSLPYGIVTAILSVALVVGAYARTLGPSTDPAAGPSRSERVSA